MHIAFLLTQSLESPSGLGRYWPVSKELVRLGHQVTILALHHNLTPAVARCFVKQGVNIWYVSQMHVRKVDHRKLYFSPTRMLGVAVLATWRLTWAALRTPADVYHIGKPHPMNGVAGLVASRLRRKPLFLDCDDYEAASGRFSHRWQRAIVTVFEDYLPRFVAGVTVNSRFIANRLRLLGVSNSRIVYVPNGIDRERFASVDRQVAATLREEWDLVGRPVVLYLGSLSLASHAVDLLLEAFATVQQAEPRAVLLLVGGGEDYDILRRQAAALGLSDGVRFVGRVPPEQVPAYYLLADASVDPVRDDPAGRARSPLKVVESLASGTPVVTGDVGDRSEQVACGGLLVSPGDATALAKALTTILKDHALRARLSAEALAGRERYHWNQLVHDFVSVYNEMV